ncbi:MAG: hypothetical protein JAY90_10635 [Candidatus Thiodiazotropha lotti]|nr:hypothetical protein [Candidatus Thiodiazotropha lotti]
MGEYSVESVRTMEMLTIRTEASLREYGYLQHIVSAVLGITCLSKASSRRALKT